MAFELLGQEDCHKNNGTYTVKLYFDADTNTQRHEYILDGEILFYLEYEAYPHDIADKDISLEAIVNGFNIWYDHVGPDWRPEAF